MPPEQDHNHSINHNPQQAHFWTENPGLLNSQRADMFSKTEKSIGQAIPDTMTYRGHNYGT